jgi:hypothetical protein
MIPSHWASRNLGKFLDRLEPATFRDALHESDGAQEVHRPDEVRRRERRDVARWVRSKDPEQTAGLRVAGRVLGFDAAVGQRLSCRDLGFPELI